MKVQEEIERVKSAKTREDIRHVRFLISLVHFLYNNNNNNNNNNNLIVLKKGREVEEINILCQTPLFFLTKKKTPLFFILFYFFP